MPLMLTRTMIVLLSRVKTQLMRTFTVKTMKLKQKILLILLILLAYLSFELSRYTIDDLKNIHIHFATTAGRHKIFISNLTLLNNGWFPIDCGPHSVTVYACFLSRVIDSENTEGKNVYGFPINAKVHHLDGCAHKVVFAPPFRLAVRKNITVSLPFRNKFISYTDYMPNLYIQLGDGPRWLVANTDQDPTHFVLPFDAKNKLQRASDDLILPLSLSERYLYQTKLNQFSELEVRAKLVPDVLELFSLNRRTEYTPQYGNLLNSVPPSVTYNHDPSLLRNQFKLTVNKDGRVEAGVESQSQHMALLVTNTITHLLHRFDYKLPVGTFLSRPPRFDYRGFMLDVARHFFDKEVIKRQIELLSYYNLNRLHLHLTDDESWSLEIDGIPELTEIGSRQCFDLSQCGTYPQLGKKLDMGKQFLTKSEYIEIVRFAESKGVMVIPEIDLPGHSTAALNAMKMRYVHSPTLTDYRLHDPLDESQFISTQYFSNGVVNPCVESTYSFTKTVVQAIQSYHKEAEQPLTVIHLGGDEVPGTAWSRSPACDTMLTQLGKTNIDDQKEKVREIKVAMFRRLGALAESVGLSLAFWEDGLIDSFTDEPFVKEEVFPPGVTVYTYVWFSKLDGRSDSRPYNLANSGYKVILAPASRYYFDHAQEPHPKDSGFYWATRYINLLTTFSFRPDNYYGNIIRKPSKGVVNEEFCDMKHCPPLIRKENIVGVEAVLFSETVPHQHRLDDSTFPRILAVAERAWKEASWEHLDGENPEGLQKDFDLFRHSIEKFEIPILEKRYNLKYHLAPPGVEVRNDLNNVKYLRLSTEFKSQRVWWRTETYSWWTELTNKTTLYPGNNQHVYLKTSLADGSRFSYPVAYHQTSTEVDGELDMFNQDFL